MGIRYYISRNIARLLPDKLYLSIKFRTRMGYWMDWENPKTFSEKLQWLKVYDRHPEYTKMVDKVAAKEYVAGIIGEEYIIPTLSVYNTAEEIDFEKLPSRFVLKCTHDSGGIVVCRDKSKLDIEEVREKMRNGLKRTYIIQNREYPYKNVPRRIIAEQYMEDESGELKDYKFFCFNGDPKYCQVISDRGGKMAIDFFDKDWIHQPFHEPKKFSFFHKPIECPKGFPTMLRLARALSANLSFVRVDLYNIHGRIYFGELTFFPTSGLGGFEPSEWDFRFGEMINLPQKND